jgi:hypothetical protein
VWESIWFGLSPRQASEVLLNSDAQFAVLRVNPDLVAGCPCLGAVGSDVRGDNASVKIGLERLCVPIALNAIYQIGSGSEGDGFLHGPLVTQSGDLRLAEA